MEKTRTIFLLVGQTLISEWEIFFFFFAKKKWILLKNWQHACMQCFDDDIVEKPDFDYSKKFPLEYKGVDQRFSFVALVPFIGSKIIFGKIHFVAVHLSCVWRWWWWWWWVHWIHFVCMWCVCVCVFQMDQTKQNRTNLPQTTNKKQKNDVKCESLSLFLTHGVQCCLSNKTKTNQPQHPNVFNQQQQQQNQINVFHFI